MIDNKTLKLYNQPVSEEKMKIRIITNANKVYFINVKSNNFEEVVQKILEKQYIMLNDDTIVLTSAIAEIEKVSN